jgi:hypothetical protein
MTPTGFCADVALAAARGINGPSTLANGGGITRAELVSLQRDLFAARTALGRVGTNLNQAVAALNATGEPSVWLGHAVARCDRTLEQIDAAAAAIDRRLR